MMGDRLFLEDNSVLALARSTEAASIDIIRAVDGTVDTLTHIDSLQRELVKRVHLALERTAKCEITVGQYIDPDDTAVEVFEHVESGMKDFLHTLVSKRSEIDRDCKLQDHHCESLHAAYDLAMTSAADVIDVVRDARHAIIAHDLAAEPRESETFDSIELLTASLRDA